MKHRSDFALAALAAAAAALHFWPMAYWSTETLVVFRVLAAFCLQLLLCRRSSPRFVARLPLLAAAGFAGWGTWLYFTSPHWQNASFTGLFGGYISPAAACLAAMAVFRFSRSHP